MNYTVNDNKIETIKSKARRKTIIKFTPLFLILGYIVFYNKIVSDNLYLNILYFLSILILAIIIDIYMLMGTMKDLRSLEITLNDTSLVKNQNGYQTKSILLTEIGDVIREKNGLLVKTNSKKEEIFIPDILTDFEDLFKHLNNLSKSK